MWSDREYKGEERVKQTEEGRDGSCSITIEFQPKPQYSIILILLLKHKIC